MVRSVLTCGSEHQSWFPGCQKGRFSGHGGTTLAPRGTFNRKEIDLTVVVGNLGASFVAPDTGYSAGSFRFCT